ncbi:MAG: MFS transporter [Actinomycetota bacterium]|nr:MFS transporter [Actinomycetota bacterium]
MKVRGRLGALEEREFRLLWLSRVVSDFGDRFALIGLAFAVLDIKASAATLGYVFAARTVSNLVLLQSAGVWADRVPRQLLMLASDVGRGSAQAALAFLLLTGRAEVWHLIVLATLYGIAEAFFGPASQGLVPQTVRPHHLHQANALMSLSRNVTGIAGPAAAGVVIAVSSTGWAIAVDAATFAVSASFLAAMRLAFTKPVRQRFITELLDGWKEFTRQTWIWVSVLYFGLFHLTALACFFVLAPVIAKRELGGSSAYATIMVGAGVGAVVGSLVAMRYKPRRQLVVVFLSTAAWSVVLVGYAVTDSVAAITIGAFLGAMSMNYGAAFWFTAMQEHVPPAALSRVSSYDWLGSWLFLPLGYVVVGPVAEAIGYTETLLIAVGWTLASSAAILLIPSVRNLRSTSGRSAVDAQATSDGGPADAVPRHVEREREGVSAR